jgi:hypothetical protein
MGLLRIKKCEISSFLRFELFLPMFSLFMVSSDHFMLGLLDLSFNFNTKLAFLSSVLTRTCVTEEPRVVIIIAIG